MLKLMIAFASWFKFVFTDTNSDRKLRFSPESVCGTRINFSDQRRDYNSYTTRQRIF